MTSPTSHRQAARDRLETQFGVQDSERYILYPVRGIRRKNIGEFVLWAEVLREHAVTLGVTLTPLNPVEKAYFDSWKDYAHQHALPCIFGTGDETGLSFAENMAASDAILTTSVAEGFGMVFLESWLAGRPLLGRNLPTVTADFKDQGVEFPTLYDACEVKVDWFDYERYQTQFRETVLELSKSYERETPSSSEIQAAIASHVRDDWIDFGDLDELMQKQVIDAIREDTKIRHEFQTRHARKIESFRHTQPDAFVEANASRVRTAYGLQASGRKLVGIYQTVMSSEPAGSIEHLDVDTVLNQFLDYRHLRLIRT